MVVLQSQYLILQPEICILVTAVTPSKNHEQDSDINIINNLPCFVPFNVFDGNI